MKVVARILLCTVFALCSAFCLSQDTTPSQSQQPQPTPSEPQSAPPPSPRPAAPTPETRTDKEKETRAQRAIATSARRPSAICRHQPSGCSAADARWKVSLVRQIGIRSSNREHRRLTGRDHQADNQFPGYGQGSQGYGKRFGAALADSVDAGFWSNFAYPTLLKQDPRYFRLGEGSFSRRVVYGIKQEFVCHTDKGGRSFNFANVLGAFTSGAISNLYYPGKTLIRTIPASATSPAMPVYENERGLELTVSRASIALGYGVAGGLFDEFWPDIQHKLFHKHQDAGANPAP